MPRLDDYAWRLWDYWERHLDPDLFIDRSLRGHVGGKVVVVTGGSSGIGHATAVMMGRAGARVAIVARDESKLAETVREIEEEGGEVNAFSADLAEMEACDEVLEQIFTKMGTIDILVNNAGRSIRRGIAVVLRPLPRLRTDHAAELFWQPAHDHGRVAGDGKETQGTGHQYFLDWRALQCTAFFRLRGVKGCAGRIFALRLFRVQRYRHQIHHDQYAAGAHTDDCADQNLRKRADHHAGRGGGDGQARGDLQAAADRYAPWNFRPGVARSGARRCRKSS